MSITRGRVQIENASGFVMSVFPIQTNSPLTVILSGSVGGAIPTAGGGTGVQTVAISGYIGVPATVRVEGTKSNGHPDTPNPVQVSGRDISDNNIAIMVSTFGKVYTITQVENAGTAYNIVGNDDGEQFTVAGGHGTTISVTGTISTSTYEEKDSIGGLWVFPEAVRQAGGRGTISTIVLTDRSRASGAIDLIFYGRAPTGGTTITDSSPLNLANQDLLKIIGTVAIGNTDYTHFVNNAVCTKPAVGIGFTLPTGTTLYCTPMARNGPAYLGTRDLCISIDIYQD